MSIAFNSSIPEFANHRCNRSRFTVKQQNPTLHNGPFFEDSDDLKVLTFMRAF